MSDMVRKHLYIHRRHQRLLEQLSRARGVSQAELVRQALEREAASIPGTASSVDLAAWETVVRFVHERRLQGGAGVPYRWRREDAYAPGRDPVKTRPGSRTGGYERPTGLGS